jgi:hypothetical protein
MATRMPAPGARPAQTAQTKPCGQDRPAYDVAGRINDLINCYLQSFGEYLDRFIPNFIMILLLIAVMIIAGYMFLKE